MPATTTPSEPRVFKVSYDFTPPTPGQRGYLLGMAALSAFTSAAVLYLSIRGARDMVNKSRADQEKSLGWLSGQINSRDWLAPYFVEILALLAILYVARVLYGSLAMARGTRDNLAWKMVGRIQ